MRWRNAGGMLIAASISFSSVGWSKQLSDDQVAAIRHCVERSIFNAPLTSFENQLIGNMHQAFLQSSCSGCHAGTSALASLAQFPITAKQSEFLKGIALRDYRTKQLARDCLSPTQSQIILNLLNRLRHRSTDGLEFFTSAGSDQEIHTMITSFLRGRFEEPPPAGTPMHDTLYEWITRSDARFPVEIMVELLTELAAYRAR